jgi:hypothetical protein
MGLRTLAEPEANTKPSGGLPLACSGRRRVGRMGMLVCSASFSCRPAHFTVLPHPGPPLSSTHGAPGAVDLRGLLLPAPGEPAWHRSISSSTCRATARKEEREERSKQAGRHRGADGVPGFLPETPLGERAAGEQRLQQGVVPPRQRRHRELCCAAPPLSLGNPSGCGTNRREGRNE